MFHPAVNRLSSFLEFGALTIALAQSGGAQYKAGFLRLEGVSPKGGFGRKAAGWREKKKQRWCAVRESYLVAMEEMGEVRLSYIARVPHALTSVRQLTVWDVFLIDQDFAIERPTRYYRQGLHLLHLDGHEDEPDKEEAIMGNGQEKGKVEIQEPRKRVTSTVGSIKSSISKFLHVGSHRHHPAHGRHSTSVNNLTVNGGPAPNRRSQETSSSEASSSVSGLSTRPLTPMLDPSTNTNPLANHDPEHGHAAGDPSEGQKKGSKDVSKHVFYVVNSQTRLKLYAKNERQMLQWIAAFERVARESHYTGRNRFDSFAPIRLNVAAQWLVDGVSGVVLSCLNWSVLTAG